MSSHWYAPSWQLEQPAVTPAWIIAVVGTGAWKPLPGTVAVALPGTRPAGAVWQLSQAVADGMCAFGPIVELAGITISLVTP